MFSPKMLKRRVLKRKGKAQQESQTIVPAKYIYQIVTYAPNSLYDPKGLFISKSQIIEFIKLVNHFKAHFMPSFCVQFKQFSMQNRSSKSFYSFHQADSMISSPSSRRQSAVADSNVGQEQSNFHQEEMNNIRQKIFVRKAIKQLQSLIARRKMPDDMFQEWQGKQEIEQVKTQLSMQSLQQKIIRLYPWMAIFSIFQGICLVLFLWQVSIAVVFQQMLFSANFMVLAVLQMVIILVKVIVMSTSDQFSAETCKMKLQKCLTPFLLLISSIIMIGRNQINIQSLNLVIDSAAMILSLCMVKKVSRYFRAIKAYAQNKKLIKELRILQLFFVLFVVAHVFGLIIYSSSYLASGETSWLTSNNIDLLNKPWHARYIYSVYWAITTIVTVGFGDLTPQNEAEVIVIMILQILGTSFFGYMINVIGITVDNINKKNEEYDNYQQTISKLKDHYQLSEQLSLEMKRDVQKKYSKSNETVSLKKNQEMDFLEYVDSTVKKHFILQTNIRIIKKSIFFLTFFTVSFQNYIALKLIRIIYKKDQNVQTYDPITKQRNVIIVNHGKVNLFIQKRQNNIIKNKLVRTIHPIEGKPTLNVIGYSSLILNQNIDLFANASEMTSGYVLRMSDVLECIDKSMIDYQSFHEMRQKMLLFPMKESIEAPTLKDPNFHYIPNIFILTCKYSKRSKQQRKPTRRLRKRGFLLLDRVKTQLSKDWYTVNEDESQSYLDATENNNKISKRIDEFESLLSLEDGEEQITPINQAITRPDQKFLNIDQVKIFEHFMKNHNINTVAANYERACSAKSYRGRIQSKYVKQRMSGQTRDKGDMRKLSIGKKARIAPIRL